MTSFPWLNVLHVLMTLMAMPYVLLAALIVGVDHVVSQRGLWAILNTFLDSLNWALTWGICGLGVGLIAICATGCFEQLRWWATLALFAMVSVTLGILFFYRNSMPSVDEMICFAPAILIVAVCCWRLIRNF